MVGYGLNRNTRGVPLDYDANLNGIDFSAAPKNALAGQVYHHPVENTMYSWDKYVGWTEVIKEHKLKDPARKYAVNIGDGNATTIVVNHNLGSVDITATIKDMSTQLFVYNATIKTYDANTIIVSFQTAPSINQYRVTVIG